MAFSASESAFEGFRIVRREPVTVAIWAALLAVMSGGATVLLLPMFTQMRAGITPGATAPTAQSMAALGQLFRIYLLLLPLYLIVISVFMAAVYRAVLRPEQRGFGRLRLGGDELRIIGLILLMGLLFMGVGLVVGIVGALVGGGVAVATRSSGSAGAVIIVLLMYLVVFAGMVWLGVRLSLAAPMTFARKRISLFGSWSLTKGRFWPLLGCYFLAWVLTILILMVDLVVSGAFMLGAAGGDFSRVATAMFRPDAASAMTSLSPIFIIRLLVGAVFGVVMWTVTLAAPAAAYREIAAPRPEDQAETFA